MSPITERLAKDFARTFASPVEYEWDGLRQWDRVTRVPADRRDYVCSMPTDVEGWDEPQVYTCNCAADAAQEYVMYWIGVPGEHEVIVDGVQYVVTLRGGYASVEVAS